MDVFSVFGADKEMLSGAPAYFLDPSLISLFLPVFLIPSLFLFHRPPFPLCFPLSYSFLLIVQAPALQDLMRPRV